MEVKYNNKWYDVLDTREFFGSTFYAIEDECRVKWLKDTDVEKNKNKVMANIPDKIYLREVDLVEVGDFLSENNDKTDIEYIRKDVLIKKALDYIENNIYDHYDGDNEYGICGGYVKKEEFIKNFKDYMKGE